MLRQDEMERVSQVLYTQNKMMPITTKHADLRLNDRVNENESK
jgi:hypothetical protein